MEKLMNKNLTEIVFILDRSGSMGLMKDDAIGGFNAFLDEQKAIPGDAKLTLVLFDHEYKLIYDGEDIQKVDRLNDETYVPRGSTALLDSIGRTVDDIGKRLSDTPEEERPGKVLVVVFTDGLENASTDYSKNKIKDTIEHQTQKYSWEFLFLGASQDSINDSKSYGFSQESVMLYNDKTSDGFEKAFRSVSEATTICRTSGSTTGWKGK